VNPEEGEKGKAAVGRICRKERIDKAACSLYNNNQTMKYVPEVTKTILNLDKIRKNKEKEREKKHCVFCTKGWRETFIREKRRPTEGQSSIKAAAYENTQCGSHFFLGGEKL